MINAGEEKTVSLSTHRCVMIYLTINNVIQDSAINTTLRYAEQTRTKKCVDGVSNVSSDT